MKKTPAAQQFAALGIPEADWTDTMRLAVKQKWSGLPVDEKVGDLRDQLAAVTVAAPASVGAVQADMLAAGQAVVTEADARAEFDRRKRNAAVNAWRTRKQLQAAIDARDLKFAALRAKRGTKVAVQPVAVDPNDGAPEHDCSGEASCPVCAPYLAAAS